VQVSLAGQRRAVPAVIRQRRLRRRGTQTAIVLRAVLLPRWRRRRRGAIAAILTWWRWRRGAVAAVLAWWRWRRGAVAAVLAWWRWGRAMIGRRRHPCKVTRIKRALAVMQGWERGADVHKAHLAQRPKPQLQPKQ
jgi:hypothetical protein